MNADDEVKYLLVRVTQSVLVTNTAPVPFALVRSAIHDTALAFDLDVSTIPVASRQRSYPDGTKVPYELVDNLFTNIFNRGKAAYDAFKPLQEEHRLRVQQRAAEARKRAVKQRTAELMAEKVRVASLMGIDLIALNERMDSIIEQQHALSILAKEASS